MNENVIATAVVDAAFKIHTTLGPGLLESVYEATLRYELKNRGLSVREQVGLPVYYEGLKLGLGYRVDLIVGDQVIIEISQLKRLLQYIKGNC